MADAQGGQWIVGDPRRRRADLLLQRQGVGRGQVQEDEPAPFGAADGIERKVLAPEAGVVAQERRADQLARRAVGPGVVGAADQASGRDRRRQLGPVRPDIARRRTQACAAMAADVVVGVENPVLAPDQQDAFAGQVDHPPGARALNCLLAAAGGRPFARENGLLFRRELSRLGIGPGTAGRVRGLRPWRLPLVPCAEDGGHRAVVPLSIL